MSRMPSILVKHIVKDSYAITPQSGFLRTDMEVGPARQRRIATSVPSHIDIRFLLDQNELGVLEAWYKHTLSEGVSWFLMPVENGMGRTDVECRFIEPYQVTLASYKSFSVSCTLEARELPVMSEAELEKYLD